MNISRIMSTPVQTLNTENMLDSAARLMHDRAIGCVPIVSSDDKLVGILTDRDIVMAAAVSGQPLASLRIGVSMRSPVHVCGPDDDLETVARIMREHGVRRLPIVDVTHRPIGVVSLDDLAHAARQPSTEPSAGLTAAQVGDVYHATSGRTKHPRDSQRSWLLRSENHG